MKERQGEGGEDGGMDGSRVGERREDKGREGRGGRWMEEEEKRKDGEIGEVDCRRRVEKVGRGS